MNPIILSEFHAVHDDLMDRLIREFGINDKPEKEFSIIEWIKNAEVA